VFDDQSGPEGGHSLLAGLRVSGASLAWTLVAGTTATAAGIIGNNLVLVSFGLVGLLDGVGSASLIVHFRHSRRHETFSERHERIALLIVTLGLAGIGIATMADSAFRLATGARSHSVPVGSFVAGASIVVLSVLAVGKHRIAPRIPSHALHSDGWVSANGAVLALVALAGTVLDSTLGLWWVDPIAAIVVAAGAVGLSVFLFRGSSASG
jgi:divalent metal cation (Fe/Co/Zn/Cd) transporter